jgi:hypothetical protein
VGGADGGGDVGDFAQDGAVEEPGALGGGDVCGQGTGLGLSEKGVVSGSEGGEIGGSAGAVAGRDGLAHGEDGADDDTQHDAY